MRREDGKKRGRARGRKRREKRKENEEESQFTQVDRDYVNLGQQEGLFRVSEHSWLWQGAGDALLASRCPPA